ncbi:MAG: hypothetical protein AAGH88_11050 [Planctomycetota bacterium]
MSRKQLCWTLGFVVVVMVCGGGCMSVHFLPQEQVELAAIGVDELTLARLNGEADPPEDGPQPHRLEGRLVVVHAWSLEQRDRFGWWGMAQLNPSRRSIATLSALPGVEYAWQVELADYFADQEQDRREQARLAGLEYEPNQSPINLPETLRAIAHDQDADLVLFVTSGTSARDFDAGLVIAQVLTLGLAPTVVINADATMTAVLLDAETGYAYAITQTEGDGFEMSSGWTRESNKRDQARVAVAEAFDQVVDRLEAAWPQMQASYRGNQP